MNTNRATYLILGLLAALLVVVAFRWQQQRVPAPRARAPAVVSAPAVAAAVGPVTPKPTAPVPVVQAPKPVAVPPAPTTSAQAAPPPSDHRSEQVAPVVAAAGAPTAAPNPDLDSLRNQVASLQAQLDAATKDAGARRHTAEIAAQDLAAAREAITQLRSENAQLSELKTLNDHEAQELERARRLTFTLNP